jgi:hypothetical protein
MSPSGYELTEIGAIDFNGSIKDFQFVNDRIGFALLSNNVGGYAEVFKTPTGYTNTNFRL